MLGYGQHDLPRHTAVHRRGFALKRLVPLFILLALSIFLVTERVVGLRQDISIAYGLEATRELFDEPVDHETRLAPDREVEELVITLMEVEEQPEMMAEEDGDALAEGSEPNSVDSLLNSTAKGNANCTTSSPAGRCKFLIAAVIGEQETKAQLHLYQVGLLSVLLGRMLVLPRVGESRLSTCGAHPFSLYYSSSTLSNFGIPYIAYEEFIEYSTRTIPALSAQIVTVSYATQSHPHGAVLVDTSITANRPSNNPRRNLCLQPSLSGMTYDFNPITIVPPATGMTALQFGKMIGETLDGHDVEVAQRSSRRNEQEDGIITYEAPDVLVMNYLARYSLWDPTTLSVDFPTSALAFILPFTYFDYAKPWILLADQIMESMGPFIGVHWRTETVPPSHLYDCAEGMILNLLAVRARYPFIRTVYLATDYPIESITLSSTAPSSSSPMIAHSSTFTRMLTPVHAIAFEHLVDSLKSDITGLVLTGYLAEEQKMKIVPDYLQSFFSSGSTPSPGNVFSIAAIDPGLVGILDKTILTQADYFLAGRDADSEDQRQCGRASSFTAQVVATREVNRGRALDNKLNIVDRWDSV